MYVCIIVCVWKLEDNLWRLFLFFYHVDSKNGTQVFRFGCTHPYLVSHLICPMEAVYVCKVCSGNEFLKF